MLICKINAGIEDEEESIFISNVKSRINGELPTDDNELSSERYVQACEVETLWNLREKRLRVDGIDDIFELFSVRVCTGDSLVNDLTRMKELAVLSAICTNWNLVQSEVQETAQMLLGDNNKTPLYGAGMTMNI